VRSVRDLRDAPEFLVLFQRVTDAPTVTQVGSATHTSIQLAIANYSQFAIKRKIRTADNSAMTTNLAIQEITVAPGEVLSTVVYLTRTDGGTGARTTYVRISHSSGGPYGTESGPTAYTWADSGGTGGGTGTGDPFNPDHISVL